MLSEVKNSALRTLIRASLETKKILTFSDLFIISGVPPSELKEVLFKMELEGIIEEPIVNSYRLKK